MLMVAELRKPIRKQCVGLQKQRRVEKPRHKALSAQCIFKVAEGLKLILN